ncbi:MAG: AAA family ATPase [Mobilitalea sp.]
MKRKLIDELIKWKEINTGKSILLTGAKGVGKTYLAYDFAKAFFENIFYLNFEREPKARSIFASNNADEISFQLTNYFHLNEEIPVESRILILDEISYSQEILMAIKDSSIPNLFQNIIYISSNRIDSEDYSDFIILPVFPLEFDEFLRATGYEWYIETIINHYNSNKMIPEIVHKELLGLHKLYLQIGGMPGMINEYLNLNSVANVSEQHGFLVSSYHDYILKDNQVSDALKMNQVFDSLTQQLMKSNRKFQYKLIRKGTTHAMYKDAIRKLTDTNYVIKCTRINNEDLVTPSKTFASEEWCNVETNTNFKLYLPDTGLLYSKIVEEQGNHFDTLHKKALLENYMAQSLQAKKYSFAFWESDSMAKIDFITYHNQELIPIEIFAGSNTRSKSISILKQKCEFSYSVKVSKKNFEYSNQVKYVPYYAVFCL